MSRASRVFNRSLQLECLDIMMVQSPGNSDGDPIVCRLVMPISVMRARKLMYQHRNHYSFPTINLVAINGSACRKLLQYEVTESGLINAKEHYAIGVPRYLIASPPRC